MGRGDRNGNVFELALLTDAAKQQAAPAHVAASDELGWDAHLLAQSVIQDISILGSRNAAEENDFTVTIEVSRQLSRIPCKWTAIKLVSLLDWHPSECAKLFLPDRRVIRPQSGVWRDY
jgi:hypothetical protein